MRKKNKEQRDDCLKKEIVNAVFRIKEINYL